MVESKRNFVNTKVKNVLLLTFQPLLAHRETLDLVYGYSDPALLVPEFCQQIWDASHHTYKYEIVEEILIHTPTKLVGDFIYPEQHLVETIDGKREPRQPMQFDYQTLMKEYEIPLRVSQRSIDEVWLMGYPYSGFSEAVMGGPNPLWLTDAPIPGTENSLRRFVVMGFNYAQDSGAMLEAFIHRAESTMFAVYDKFPKGKNKWEMFTAVEKTHPGYAGVGTAHYAPNSLSPHDFKNNRYVMSSCDDWLAYPELKGKVKTVNHTEWGYGSRIQHHLWWLKHLPRGVSKTDGVYNNWWHYIMTPDWVNYGGFTDG